MKSMRVFEVREHMDYQPVMTEDEEKTGDLIRRRDNFLEGATPSIGDFDFPNYYVSVPKAKRGNFFGMGTGLWLFDEAARSALKGIVEAAGNLFKVEVEDVGTLNALEVTEVCRRAVDHERSRWRGPPDGRWRPILEYAFHEDEIDTKSGLFLVPENRFSRTFAVTDRPGSPDDFFKRYQDTGLSGLEFRLLWNSDA